MGYQENQRQQPENSQAQCLERTNPNLRLTLSRPHLWSRAVGTWVGAANRGAQRRDRAAHGAVVVPGANAFHHRCNDSSGLSIGDYSLQAVANLNSNLVVLGKNENRKAIIEALSSDFPCLESGSRPIFNRFAAQGGADPDDQLMAGAQLIRPQLSVETSNRVF